MKGLRSTCMAIRKDCGAAGGSGLMKGFRSTSMDIGKGCGT